MMAGPEAVREASWPRAGVSPGQACPESHTWCGTQISTTHHVALLNVGALLQQQLAAGQVACRRGRLMRAVWDMLQQPNSAAICLADSHGAYIHPDEA